MSEFTYDRYRKCAYAASELMRLFTIEDIYIIMRRIDRIYPPYRYSFPDDFDRLEVEYECFARCRDAERRVNLSNVIASRHDQWPFEE